MELEELDERDPLDDEKMDEFKKYYQDEGGEGG